MMQRHPGQERPEATVPCDVLVIGGGPAGATVSALLAERGRHVVVVEKDRHPRFHVGESLLPQNLELFEQLGIHDEIRRIGVYKPGAEFVATDRGEPIIFRFANALGSRYTHAYQVRRSEFDATLIANARRRGAEVHEATRVIDVAFPPDAAINVRALDESGMERSWAPRFVVDASGRDTFLAGRLAMSVPNKRNNTAAIYAHFRGVERHSGEDEGLITIHLFDEGWIWMIPLRENVMSVGVVARSAFFKRRTTDVATFFRAALAAVPSVAQRMNDAQLASKATSTGNYSYASRQLAGDRYLLVGDAYAFIDPIFSSGVMLAMSGGRLAADAIGVWLDDPARARPLFKTYERKVRHGLSELSWLIYRINDPVFRDMLLAPSNRFRMREGLTAILAGNIHGDASLRVPMAAFRSAFYFLKTLQPLGFRLTRDGLRRLGAGPI